MFILNKEKSDFLSQVNNYHEMSEFGVYLLIAKFSPILIFSNLIYQRFVFNTRISKLFLYSWDQKSTAAMYCIVNRCHKFLKVLYIVCVFNLKLSCKLSIILSFPDDQAN